jgi:hypothetical protein
MGVFAWIWDPEGNRVELWELAGAAQHAADGNLNAPFGASTAH